eukprot:scaffold8509_cov127-Skeletonema_menzelii.AAC.2
MAIWHAKSEKRLIGVLQHLILWTKSEAGEKWKHRKETKRCVAFTLTRRRPTSVTFVPFLASKPSLQLRRLLCYCYPTTVEAAAVAVVAEQGGVKEAEAEEHHVPPFLKNRSMACRGDDSMYPNALDRH